MNAFDYDKIGLYLDGGMNAEESKAFEVQMQQDTGLQKEVLLLKDLNETLRIKLYPDNDDLSLAANLDKLRDEYFRGKSVSDQSRARIVSIRRTRWIASIAAVFIGIIMLTIWKPWEKQDLYLQYASVEMPGVAERGVQSDSLLIAASEKFNKKQFAESLPVFEKILKNDPRNSFALYYFGIALLENGAIDSSRNELARIYNGQSLFRYDAAFYLALGYLKVKDNDHCKEWLNRIPAGAGIYQKARELLGKL